MDDYYPSTRWTSYSWPALTMPFHQSFSHQSLTQHNILSSIPIVCCRQQWTDDDWCWWWLWWWWHRWWRLVLVVIMMMVTPMMTDDHGWDWCLRYMNEPGQDLPTALLHLLTNWPNIKHCSLAAVQDRGNNDQTVAERTQLILGAAAQECIRGTQWQISILIEWLIDWLYRPEHEMNRLQVFSGCFLKISVWRCFHINCSGLWLKGQERRVNLNNV